MYKFKYHPDGVVCINGLWGVPYAEFMNANPDFPLIEGQFLEYGDDGLDFINNQGHHSSQDLSDFEPLIKAIGGICGV